MKNALLIINGLLIAAVGFLYYKVFSNPKQSNTTVKEVSTSSNVAAAAKPTIAYVDLDSLNEHIIYIKSKRKSLEAEQSAIETEWENGMRSLQAKRDNFVKNASSITQEQAEKFQAELMQGQEQVEARKQNSGQALADKSSKFMEEIQRNLKSFLNDYNKEKGYTYILTSGTGLDYMVYKDSTLNITKDVIAGMNERMKGR